jgi:hypothetical protein
MTKTYLATLGLLALLATGSAFGQQGMTFDIPFDFRIGTSVMPAGEYKVTQFLNSGLTDIASEARKVDVRVLTHVGGRNAAPNKSKLVFNRYGDRYFLSSVWQSGTDAGRVLPVSKVERELALRASPPRSSQIVVARR